MSIKDIPNRNEVPENLTWDLTTIFSNHLEFEKAYQNIANKAPNIKELKGTLANSSKHLLNVTESILKINRSFDKVYIYAQLANDVDTSNAMTQSDLNKVENLATIVDQNQAWFDFEVVNLGKNKITEFVKQTPKLSKYKRLFELIFESKDHILAPDQEKLIAGAANIFNAPEKIFGMLDSSDFSFPMVEDESGKQVKLSNGIYSLLLQSHNVDVRENTFKSFYTVFNQFQNTLATTLGTQVEVNNYQAKIHNYTNAREMAMHENEVPNEVYDILVKSVNKHLPLLHRYVALRKKILNLNEMHMYDMYVPLAKEPKIKYTFERAKEIVLEALSVFGPEYIKNVKKEFQNRWIDIVENKGKRTGAYSSGVYDTNPFILLNWQDNLDNVYTLAHETGHSMHSFFSNENQPYQYSDYPIFVAEIASTTNENILTDYLLNHVENKELKKYILSSYLEGFKGTIFRQTQFAEFENLIHLENQNGTSLTADYLDRQYLKLNKKYYGDEIISDPEIALEWSRIPHFYYDFYVYQYATGFAAASTLANKIVHGSKDDITNYLNYLKSGNSKTPIQTMKAAGVDMMNGKYLDAAFDKFEERMNELEKLI